MAPLADPVVVGDPDAVPPDGREDVGTLRGSDATALAPLFVAVALFVALALLFVALAPLFV